MAPIWNRRSKYVVRVFISHLFCFLFLFLCVCVVNAIVSQANMIDGTDMESSLAVCSARSLMTFSCVLILALKEVRVLL
jgi:UDP-N-acetylmuramyl pentapeptide phosphotransferase/UDP-N-acetylglucosamine-1-phosphate transferase